MNRLRAAVNGGNTVGTILGSIVTIHEIWAGHRSAWWDLAFIVAMLCLALFALGWWIGVDPTAVGKAVGPWLRVGVRPAGVAVNPRYDVDLRHLGDRPQAGDVVGPGTVVIVVGGRVNSELIERPVAAVLRDEIDRRGGGRDFRRAVVVGWDYWSTDASLARQPTVAIGYGDSNPLAGTVEAGGSVPPWTEGPGRAAFAAPAGDAGPRVALLANGPVNLRLAVESWARQPDGLAQFLRKDAGWG